MTPLTHTETQARNLQVILGSSLSPNTPHSISQQNTWILPLKISWIAHFATLLLLQP